MPRSLGPYRLVRPLGHGGTAELYLAEDPREPDSEPVVVKRLHPHLRVYDEAIELFLQEARLALRCAGHPNIVRVLDAGQDGAEHYIAMEYVDGVTLGDLMAERAGLGRAAPGAVLQVLVDTCAALTHVHARGVVHRDVNPRNIIVDRAGVARLIDFGVAAPEPVEGAETSRGTWAYMSPEQVEGTPTDRRSDVFSVGVLLWELWAGERLFFRGPPYLTMPAVVACEVPRLEDAAVDAIARRCLARRPEERLGSARELAKALAGLGIELSRDAVTELIPT